MHAEQTKSAAHYKLSKVFKKTLHVYTIEVEMQIFRGNNMYKAYGYF